jgi:chromosome segregation ATPase
MNIQNSNDSSSTLKFIHTSIQDLKDGQKAIDLNMTEALETVNIVSEDFGKIDDRIKSMESKQIHDMKRRVEVERKIRSFEGLAKTTEQDIMRAREQIEHIQQNIRIIDNSVGKINE